MPTALAYSSLDEILNTVVARLQDELGLTQQNCFFTLDPDKDAANNSGDYWVTVQPGHKLKFSRRHINAGGFFLVRTETEVGIRISSVVQNLDASGQAPETMTAPDKSLPFHLGNILNAMFDDEGNPWNPSRANGDLLTVEGFCPLDATFSSLPQIAICEVAFEFSFDWALAKAGT